MAPATSRALLTFIAISILGFGVGLGTGICGRCLPQFANTWRCGCVMFDAALPNWAAAAIIVTLAATSAFAVWRRSRNRHAA